MALFGSIITALDRLTAEVKRLSDLFERECRPRTPDPVIYLGKQELDGMILFSLLLPKPSVSDVVTQELTIDGEGGGTTEYTPDYENDHQEIPGFEGPEDSTVTGRLVDIDNKGNRSEPREFSFTLTDTFAPPMPGEVAIKQTAET